MAMQILLTGAHGRMGKTLSAIASDYDCEVAFPVGRGDDAAADMAACDVIIDFSLHSVTPRLAALAAASRKPMIIGTTGHSDEERRVIGGYAETIAMVWEGNFSVGVNTVFHLTAEAAGLLGESFNPEVVEIHHRNKVDAPSGTAEQLVEIIRGARRLAPEVIVYGRHGITGSRKTNEIGVHSLRGGDVVGEHTVIFSGDGERIEIIHRASDRRIFASGALRAARWVLGRCPGIYKMSDVLGLA